MLFHVIVINRESAKAMIVRLKEEDRETTIRRRREIERVTAERDYLRERDRARSFYENEGW